MKKWYCQLKNRILVHIILIAINIISFFIVGTSAEDVDTSLFAVSWVISTVFEIIFIVFEVQFRANKASSAQAQNNAEECDEIVRKSSEEFYIEGERKGIPLLESKKDFNRCTEHNGVRYALKYVYKENLCFVENLDKVNLEENDITYHWESDNEYDPNTIAVYVRDIRVGLMYKGACRDIILRCLKNGSYEVAGFICKLDIDKNQIAIKVGFFTPLENRKSFTTSIIKTSKKDMFDNKRQDNVEYLNENDLVYFSVDYESDGLVVSDEYGNELGEISESAKEKINNDTADLNTIIGVVEETYYSDSGNKKAKIRIYLTEEI